MRLDSWPLDSFCQQLLPTADAILHARCRQSFPPHWPFGPRHNHRIWDLDQTNQKHVLNKLLHILLGPRTIHVVFLRDGNNQLRECPLRLQQSPNQGSGFVEAVYGRQISDFATDGHDQRLATNYPGNNCPGPRKWLLF